MFCGNEHLHTFEDKNTAGHLVKGRLQKKPIWNFPIGVSNHLPTLPIGKEKQSLKIVIADS